MKKLRWHIAAFVIVVLCLSLFTAAFAYEVSAGTTVYVTSTGTKYHRAECTYLASKKAMTIAAAEAKGYTPCSRCHPDVLTGEYKSNWNGSSWGSNGSTTVVRTPTPTPSPTPTPKSEQKGDDVVMLCCVIAIVVLLVIITIVDSKRQNHKDALAKANSKLQKTENALQLAQEELERVNIQLQAFRKGYTQLKMLHKYQGVNVTETFKIPKGFIITENGMPYATQNKALNEGVFYSQSGIYHKRSCANSGYYGKTVKLWETKFGRPCKLCRPPVCDFSWYYNYQSTISQIEKSGLVVTVANDVITISGYEDVLNK